MDYKIAKTPSMHCRLGSGTVTAGFPQGRQPDFPWEKSHWDNTIVKMKKKQEKKIIIHHQTDYLNEKKNTWMRQSQIAAAILHAPQSDGLVLGPRCQNDAVT